MEPTVPLAVPAATDSRLSSRLTRAAEALDGQRPLSSAQLRKAAVALKNGPPGAAKSLLTDYLAKHPGDCDAMYLLARVLMAAHESMQAEELLAQCLEQLPDFDAARFHYARTLLERMKSEAALDQVEILLAKDPKNFLFRDLKGTALWRLGRDAEAVEWYRALTDDYPDMEVFWLRYAYRLRAVGRREECIRAYRKLIEICPSYGGAYWSLGDLKTFRFSGNDIAEMQTQLRGTNLSAENRSYFHFALAKAYADQELYGKAFEQYARANALRRVEVDHDPNLATDYVTACKALMTREFFEARAECGTASSGPIFVLGMHRSGSTLVEQILSSHSAIEGIGEAPEIMSFAKRLEFEIAPKYGTGYPGIIGLVDAATLTALGSEY